LVKAKMEQMGLFGGASKPSVKKPVEAKQKPAGPSLKPGVPVRVTQSQKGWVAVQGPSVVARGSEAEVRAFAAKANAKAPAAVPKPPGTGWQAIPGGKKGGFRKRSGTGWSYWYPDKGVTSNIHEQDHGARAARIAELEAKLAEKPKDKPPEPAPVPPVKPEPPKAAPPEKPAPAGAQRRYIDVGEKVGGARKDLAAQRAELASMTQDQLEENPGAAYKMVTKRTVFGLWSPDMAEQDKANGVSAEASWWKRRLQDAIVGKPPDSAGMREAYRRASQFIEQSFSRIRTVNDVHDFMQEWHDAMSGDIWKTLPKTDPLYGVVKAGLQGFGSPAYLAYLNQKGPQQEVAANIDKKEIQADGTIRVTYKGEGEESRGRFRDMTVALGRKFAETMNIRYQQRRGYRETRTYLTPMTPTPLRKITPAAQWRTTKPYQQALLASGKEVIQVDDKWAWAGAKKEPGKGRSKVGRTKKGEKEFVFERKLGVVERKGLPDRGVEIGPVKASASGTQRWRTLHCSTWPTSSAFPLTRSGSRGG
jgi:hypothetical protein